MKTPAEVSMKVQRVAGALSRVSIWNVNQSPSGVFLRGRMVFDFFQQGGVEHIKQKISCFRVFLEKGHRSLVFRPGKKYHVSGEKIAPFQQYKKDHIPARSILKRPSFQNIWSKYLISVYLFLRKIIFHFPSAGKIIFSGKRKIIIPDNTGKIESQRNFFKTIFSGRLENENMVFRAVYTLAHGIIGAGH